MLGVLVNCKALRPGKETALSTPSTFSAVSVILRSTASVRDSEAPSGSLVPLIRKPLSWLGMKPPGTVWNMKPAATEQQQIDHEYRAAPAQRPRDGTLIAVRAHLEEAVERAEQPAEQAVDQARRQVLRRVVRLEQQGGQRRRQGQRVDRRDHRRDGDGHGKLLVELTDDAIEESHWHEHRAKHQCNRHDRPRHLAHRLVRRRKRTEPFLDVALDVLHHHDRVVDDDADRQHQAEQAERVDREAEQIEHGERADDRHRHRDQRNDGRAPGLQEQDHHQHDQHHRLEQRGDHGIDRVAHEHRRVVDRGPAHIRWKARRQLVHPGAHGVGNFEGVGARRLEDADGDRFLVVQLGAQRVVAGAEFDAGDIGEANHLAIYCRS